MSSNTSESELLTLLSSSQEEADEIMDEKESDEVSTLCTTSVDIQTSKEMNSIDSKEVSLIDDSLGFTSTTNCNGHVATDKTDVLITEHQGTLEMRYRTSYGRKIVMLCRKVRQSWFFAEAQALWKLALPILLMWFFQQLLLFCVVLLVGHFSDKTTFGAVSLANSFFNVTGFSIIVGLSSAGDTLCPQSYGFKNYLRVGVILQRGILILGLACLPIAVVWLNSESILLLLQQQPCVARLASQYLRVAILVLPALVLFIMFQKYLQAQSVVWMFVMSTMVMSVVGISLCAVFIIGAELGAIGASLSIVIAYTLQPLLLIGYTRLRGLHKKTWGGWSWQSLDEWGQFLKLGVPGFLMLCFEWWTYEISLLVTGTIDNTQLAVNSILMQLMTFAFMIPLSFSIAVSVRVGNELGAGNPLKAKRASYTAVAMDAVIALCLAILLLLTRNHIGKAFISDEDVIHETGRALYAASGLLFTDHLQGTISGILRGTGRQALAAVINFTAFYIIGLPIGICLALLADMGTLGMWIGLGIASTLQGTSFFIILLTTNWEKQSEIARKNANDSNKMDNESEDSSEECAEQCDEHDDQVPATNMSVNHDGEITHSLAATVFKEKDEPDFDVPNGEVDIEEVPLVSHQDVEELTEVTSPSSKESNVKRTRLRLLLTKGSVFAVAILLLVVGAVLAGVFPHGGTLEPDCIVNNTCYCNDSYTEPMVLFNSSLLTTTSECLSFVRPTSTVNLWNATSSSAIHVKPTQSVS